MTDLIKWRNFTNVLPSWYFNFFSFFLFLFFLFLLSFFLFEFNTKICQLKLNHVVNHFLNLILNFRQNSLFYFLCFGFIFRTCLIFPLFGVFINFLLNCHNGFSWSASRIIFLEFVLLC